MLLHGDIPFGLGKSSKFYSITKNARVIDLIEVFHNNSKLATLTLMILHNEELTNSAKKWLHTLMFYPDALLTEVTWQVLIEGYLALPL